MTTGRINQGASSELGHARRAEATTRGRRFRSSRGGVRLTIEGTPKPREKRVIRSRRVLLARSATLANSLLTYVQTDGLQMTGMQKIT